MFINILVFFVMIIDKIIDIVYNQYIQYYNFGVAICFETKANSFEGRCKYIICEQILCLFCLFITSHLEMRIDVNIIITNNLDTPIYEQIKEQIKNMIFNGELNEGDALPSMRVLAKELRISIITTKRAYEELEREGYIESYTGKGSFVKGINRDMLKENVLCEIENTLDLILDKAAVANISYEEILNVLQLLYQERESSKDE